MNTEIAAGMLRSKAKNSSVRSEIPMNEDVRFRQVNRYAAFHGYAAGFPNFHEANYGDGVVYGTYLLSDRVVEWRDVPRDTYGVYRIEDVPALFRAANDFAMANNFAAGFPTCEQAIVNGAVVYGTNLIRPGMAEVRDVLRSELKVKRIENVPAMMRAADDWAGAHGYAAGFPNFHQADHGAGVVCGVVLFPPGTVTWRDTAADFLRRYTKPTPWKIILCHASDNGPIFRGQEKATRFFTRAGAGTGNAYDYWRDISYGTIDIGDSTVHGPFALAVDDEEVNRYKSHEQRNNVAQWGVDAARANGIAIDDDKDHVCIVINSICDVGKSTKHRVVFCAPFGPTEMFSEQGFIAHEMGHGLTLTHSFGENEKSCGTWGGPGEYCDPFDIMSYANVQGFNIDVTPVLRISRGPGAHCVNLQRLGAMDHTRIWKAPAGEFDVLVTLAALNRADVDAPLMATFQATSRHPDQSPVSTYSLEYREPTGWDRGFGGPVVLIRETTKPRHTILLTDYFGGALSAAYPFVTPDMRFSVRLVKMDSANSTATIRIRSLGGDARIRIEEIVLNPPGGDPLEEHVVITNGTLDPIDMNGWTLSDAAPAMPHVFKFPALTLQPGGAVVVWTGKGMDALPNLFWNRMAAVWNNTGDTATLRDANDQIVSQLTVS